jgi:trimeric autotransporter adhesin
LRTALVLALLAAVAAPASAARAASSAPVPFPIVDGSVQSLLVAGDTAYVGGHFTSIGTLTGPLAFLGPRNGRVLRGFPSIAGRSLDEADENWVGVHAVDPDGAGGLYVAGHFGRVAGQRRSAVVHLRRDGSVDPRFRADVEGWVHALALARGRLWIGGSFRSVAGRERLSLAVVDARSGALTPLAAPGTSGEIHAIEPAGGRVYVGGLNAVFDGDMRGLGAFDAATGELLAWKPQTGFGWPDAITVRGDSVYVAGGTTVEFSAADGRVVREFVDGATDTEELVVAGNVLIASGRPFGDSPRGLFAFDRRTGEPLPRFAGFTGGVTALARHRDTLYANRLPLPGGPLRSDVVALNLQSGRVRWTKRQPALVHQMRVHRGRLVVAGEMRSFGAVERRNLAAIDLSTGRVKRFDPAVTGFGSNPFIHPFVRALAKRGRTLYVGGAFSEIGGVRRQNLAAVDAVTGRLRGDLPDVGGSVLSLARVGDKLFVGGEYFGLGVERRSNLGAIDLRTRRPTAWAPEPNCEVEALLVSRGLLHAGGCFNRIADRTDAPGLAAFDPGSGRLSSRFVPQRGGAVFALAADGRGGLWVGGSLGGLPNGEERGLDHLGADGRPSGQAPVVEGSVYALAARGGLLHLGGAFSRVGGRGRPGLATVRSGGSVTAFDPRPARGGRMALAALPRGGLLAGGPFGSMELRATSGLARFRR